MVNIQANYSAIPLKADNNKLKPKVLDFKANSSANVISLSQIPSFALKQRAISPSFCGPAAELQTKVAANIAEKFSFEKFVKFLKTIDTNVEEAAEKLINDTLKSKVLMGEGRFHKVFSIPNNELFVLRIDNTLATGKNNIKLTGKLKPVDLQFPDVNLGQPIAKINTFDNNQQIEILRKVKGSSIGVPYDIRQEAKKLGTIIDNKLVGEDFYVDNIKKISEIPQYAYNELAQTVKSIGNYDYVFDITNPNNVLLHQNSSQKFRFNIIDDLIKMDDISRKYGRAGWNGTVEDIAIPLMDTTSNQLYWNLSPNLAKNEALKQEIQNFNKEILEKSIRASLTASLPKPKNNDKMIELFKMSGLDSSVWKKIEYNWYNLKSDINAGKKVDIFE